MYVYMLYPIYTQLCSLPGGFLPLRVIYINLMPARAYWTRAHRSGMPIIPLAGGLLYFLLALLTTSSSGLAKIHVNRIERSIQSYSKVPPDNISNVGMKESTTVSEFREVAEELRELQKNLKDI